MAYRPMPLLIAAATMRSGGFSPAKTWRRPFPASPIRASGPTRTLSKNKVNCLSADTNMVSSGWYTTPGGVHRHDEHRERSVSASGASASRVMTSSASASSIAEMKYLEPEIVHPPSPSRRAVVETL